jgi:hypothetical protein
MLIILGTVMFLIGIGLAGYSVQYFLDLAQLERTQQLILLQTSYIRGGSLITGLGFIIGSIVGLWRTVAGFLN